MIANLDYIQVLERAAALSGEQDAYVFLDAGETVTDTVSYRALVRRSQAVAAELQSRCQPGDRVLLLYPSCIDYMVAFFACLYAGLIAVPVFPPRSSKHNSRLEAILADCGAHTALTTSGQLADMRLALAASPALAELTMLCSDTVEITRAEQLRRVDIGSDSIAFLQYTSGSTGQPKGVIVSHGNLIHNQRMIQQGMRTGSDSVIVNWLPIYHDMGLIGSMLHTIWLGTQCVFMAPVTFLQRPLRWLLAVSRYQAYVSGGPNFGYQLCADKISDEQLATLDLSSWRVAFNGAEPVRHATLERFAQRFASAGFRHDALYPCYGMAETTLIASGNRRVGDPVYQWVDKDSLSHGLAIVHHAGDEHTQALVSSGQSLLDQDLRIVDPKTRLQCPEQIVGEIWIAGDHIGGGYWQKPEVNREVFQAWIDGSDAGPFLRTGDLGYLSGGELFVTGRLKDVIIIRGANYYPQDIETSIEAADGAINGGGVAVFGLSGEQQERVIAVAEIERSQMRKFSPAVLSAKLRQWVLERHELLLGEVVFIRPGTLPKTSSGKVQRSFCRQLYLAGELSPIEQTVAQEVEA